MAHVTDAGARLVGLGFAEDADRAVRRTKKTGEYAEKRGFAGAVFAEENVAAAGLEIQRNLAESGKAAEELGHLDELRVKWTREIGPRWIGPDGIRPLVIGPDEIRLLVIGPRGEG